MKKNFNEVEFLFPEEIDVEAFLSKSSFEPFSDVAVNYLNALSKEITKHPKIRLYPDVATFSFFCRRSNILSLKKKYFLNDVIRLGRGIAFHIAPSNVPVNFAYSLITGILAGNLNIVRVPSKNFEQIDIICEAINGLNNTSEFKFISSRLALVRFSRSNSATNYFSSICDVRIIWGGDETISNVRENKLPPRSFDLTFSDRYSLCLINANKILEEKSLDKLVQAFYNDTYLFDQNACTAPHLLIWLGSKSDVDKAKTIFWESLYEFIKLKYIVQPIIAVDKLTSFYNQSVHMNQVKKTATPDNLIWRVDLNDLPKNIDEFRCNSGYFSEYHASSISEIKNIVDSKYQTLSYYGISKVDLNNFIINERPQGIDRIVPVGKTTDFSLNWDGFDLIKSLSRIIEVK